MGEKRPNIWELAQEVALSGEKQLSAETTVAFVGNKQAGKSSIIYRFIDRNETPKSTLALEYSFARRQRSNDATKDVCNIWELGGGNLFTNLLEFVITGENLMTLSVILVVDLSVPEEMLVTADTLLDSIRERIDTVLAKESNFEDKETLIKRATERVGQTHEDINQVNPFLIPLLILGSKYDLFQDFDSEKKKTITRFLRLVAHVNGAALQYVTTKSETLINKARLNISHLAFGSALPSFGASFDHNRPLIVPFGGDSFQLIGYDSLDSMRRAFSEHFPQVGTEVVIPDDPAKDSNFKERDIDLVRAQKDQELEEFKRQFELRHNFPLP